MSAKKARFPSSALRLTSPAKRHLISNPPSSYTSFYHISLPMILIYPGLDTKRSQDATYSTWSPKHPEWCDDVCYTVSYYSSEVMDVVKHVKRGRGTWRVKLVKTQQTKPNHYAVWKRKNTMSDVMDCRESVGVWVALGPLGEVWRTEASNWRALQVYRNRG